MSEPCDPLQNSLLRELNPREFQGIAPCLELVSLSGAEVLYEANEKLQYAYFPVTTVASLLCGLENGASVEVAVVGNEGMLDISVFTGGNAALTQAMIHSGGYGYRIAAESLRAALLRSKAYCAGTLQQTLLRYAQGLIMQMAQTSACNRSHSVEQHLCRWLLLNFDRMQTHELAVTQEMISNILGARRASITEAAGKLQQAGIISCHRGHIQLINRPELEARACECYNMLKKSGPPFVLV